MSVGIAVGTVSLVGRKRLDQLVLDRSDFLDFEDLPVECLDLLALDVRDAPHEESSEDCNMETCDSSSDAIILLFKPTQKINQSDSWGNHLKILEDRKTTTQNVNQCSRGPIAQCIKKK